MLNNISTSFISLGLVHIDFIVFEVVLVFLNDKRLLYFHDAGSDGPNMDSFMTVTHNALLFRASPQC